MAMKLKGQIQLYGLRAAMFVFTHITQVIYLIFSRPRILYVGAEQRANRYHLKPLGKVKGHL